MFDWMIKLVSKFTLEDLDESTLKKSFQNLLMELSKIFRKVIIIVRENLFQDNGLVLNINGLF